MNAKFVNQIPAKHTEEYTREAKEDGFLRACNPKIGKLGIAWLSNHLDVPQIDSIHFGNKQYQLPFISLPTTGVVGYARRNWLVPVPEFATREELNRYLLEKCRAEGQRQLRGMHMCIGKAFLMEREHLLFLPPRPYPCCTLHPAPPNGFGLVSFRTNYYSVPSDHAN